MKQTKLHVWLLLALIVFLGSCREDIINTGGKDTPITKPVVLVDSSIKGRIMDTNGLPVADAIVTIPGEQTTSDVDGFFFMTNKKMNQNGAIVKAEKNGYFVGIKMLNAKKGTTSTVDFRLISLNQSFSGKVSNSIGGEVTNAGGVKLTFEPNEVTFEDGSPYNGDVNVHSYYIDPTSENLSTEMPGDLRGITSEGVENQLQTVGMVAVHLLSSTGQKLQVKEGATIKMEMPIAEKLQNSVTSEIPLWSLNEETGYWEEEGKAVREGNYFVGEIPHFSFWNYDYSEPSINLQGSVTINGEPYNNCYVAILLNDLTTAGGSTNEDGSFGGNVPKDETLTIEILDYCSTIVYTQEIGPFSEDTALDNINIESSTVPTTISGVIVDCDNNPVSNGYVRYDLNNHQFSQKANADGSFSFSLFNCFDTDPELTFIDIDKAVKSDVLTVTDEGDVSLGEVQACGNFVGVFKVSTDGGLTYEVFIEPSATYVTDDAGKVFLSLFSANTPNQDSSVVHLMLDTEVLETGDKPVNMFDYLSFSIETGDFQRYGCTDDNSGGNCGTVNLELNEDVGGFVKGSGNITCKNLFDPSLPELDIMVDFHVKREE